MVRQYHRRNVRLILAAGLALVANGVTAAPPVTPAMVPAAQLTAQPGDPRRGETVALDFNGGDCNGCHKLPVANMQADAFGDLGPDLAGVGARLTVPELRQRIIDARTLNPDTIMPPFYSTAGLTRVDPKYAGKPILTAQDVEDVVAYLATLK